VAKIAEHLRLKPGRKVRLADHDPAGTPGARSKSAAQDPLAKNLEKLYALQYRLYAENRRSLLIVLQGMDASGKDGAIRHVMGGLNPQGCTVTPFKAPTSEELDHDFLWRIHRALPARGDFGIFNRSHYEDVLVVRVHNLVPPAVWKQRYAQINEFERMLSETGTTIVKFFLHISPEEQLRRFKQRLEDPTRQWKINPNDFEERKHWKEYVLAYEAALHGCNTEWAPWHVVPSDHKWYRNLAISQVLVETLEALNPQFPKPTFDPKKIKLV
jgi:PPK2 family polyphosphate:nucleotide phosphotransferase